MQKQLGRQVHPGGAGGLQPGDRKFTSAEHTTCATSHVCTEQRSSFNPVAGTSAQEWDSPGLDLARSSPASVSHL